jgi:hypothetical protein
MTTAIYRGARLPLFVPCIGGRCPDQMQLEGYGDPTRDPVYRCMRESGRKRRGTNETYTASCFYHDHPYRAADYAYWHQDPEKPIRPEHIHLGSDDEIYKTFI